MRFIILLLFSNILFSQTQIELNLKAKEKYELINKELITLHNKLLILYKNKLEKKSEIIINHKNTSIVIILLKTKKQAKY